ncbi:helix-turn-helix domain-containing protein [Streptosporangium saharense]|uniref:DNA-binding transcriptional regulator GbsR (MarR family) n=1 Tax=Streptosporangium saharense TaxID=1706840 RepID=A0A7W7QJX6_9ACTN|nr:helix-turn-helix domain-containing protein [Streptosporangium saharense]MBB4914946.1 DNA-binding transcriptional regulator GbsR (MarR family) [Streptosporangium saharense]
MPESRLTHEDRRRIAVWLAEGLGYAEIARRLGRPTSTISREVARNGAADGYLADHAQRATGRRARRRGPVRTAASSAGAREAESVRGFVDRFATLLAGTGLPRMPARVFACLLTSDVEGLTSADLVHRLQVSPASVSKAIGYLEAIELVRRARNFGRRERYVVGDDVWLRAFKADTGAHAEVAAAARHGIEIFGADTPAGVRLGRTARFFTWISEQMNDSGLTDAVARDALTALAALVYAARPLTVDELAAALDWPVPRTADALDAIGRRPALSDPLTVEQTGRGVFAVAPRPDRLSPAQRDALLPHVGEVPPPGGGQTRGR